MLKNNRYMNKLTDEELAPVAGGTWKQTADDSHFLHCLDNKFLETSTAVIMFTPGHLTENRVKREWAKYGIDYEYHGGAIYDNKYRINGKDISRGEAYAHARAIAWGN